MDFVRIGVSLVLTILLASNIVPYIKKPKTSRAKKDHVIFACSIIGAVCGLIALIGEISSLIDK